MKKAFSKKLGIISSILVVSCLTGYLLLVLAYCLPISPMQDHLLSSTETFQRESAYPMFTNYKNSTIDNFTDALMILTASYPPENIWKDALDVPRYSMANLNPYETLLSLYTNSAADLHSETYARYWHGYLIFLKPLLLLFDYSSIRYLLILIQLGLFTLIVRELAFKKTSMILPTFFVWIFLNPVATMLSMQYNSVLSISFLAMFFILYLNRTKNMNTLFKWEIFFMIVGECTSYFDLLTYPLVSLGIPLTLWLFLFLSESIKDNIKNILSLSTFWIIGYGGLWGAKWTLGNLIVGTNLIADALKMIQFRTASEWDAIKFTFFDIIHTQWDVAQNYGWMLILLLALLLFRLVKTKKIILYAIIPYVIIAVYPFAWYFVLKNHSYIHCFFTYRELSISIYAITSLCMQYPKASASFPKKDVSDVSDRWITSN